MKGLSEGRPSFLRGLRALTRRELKKWLYDPVTVLMLVLQPLIWMALLGKAMNIQGLFSLENVKLPSNVPVAAVNGTAISQVLNQIGSSIMKETFGVADYFSFMSVGIVSMMVVTTSMFSGMSIVWDRRLGFLGKVISTPVPRPAIIFAKILSASLRSMLQATIVLALAYALGLRLSDTFTPLNMVGVYAAIFLMSVGLSAIFLAFSIRSSRMERPMQFVSLITMPLMFASNVFFPAKLMPSWLQAIVNVNPLTYLTDALRQLTILQLDVYRLLMDFAYLGAFALALSVVGVALSWRYLTL